MLGLLFVELPVGEFDEFDVETMCGLSDVLALLRSNVWCMIGTSGLAIFLWSVCWISTCRFRLATCYQTLLCPVGAHLQYVNKRACVRLFISLFCVFVCLLFIFVLPVY